MDAFLQDLRYALRMIAKSPGFTAVALLTLALGIGVNSALFSIVDAVLLNPLPYSQPQQLVSLYQWSGEFARGSLSYPNFLDWQKGTRTLSSVAAYRSDNFNLTGMGQATRLKTDMVSWTFFPTLGVSPILGRNFTADEDRVGGAPVVLISEGLWKRLLGHSGDVLHKTLTLNGKDYAVIGVIPGSFHLDRSNEIWVPIGQWADPSFRDRQISMGTEAVGRMKPGVTLPQAQADMDAVAAGVAAAYPEADKGMGIGVYALKNEIVGDVRPFLLVLLAAVGFVLLIACANVANLLLARATRRGREFAIRAALGASGGQIVRQLLCESVVLGVIAGALGFAIAAWATPALLTALPETLPRAGEIHVNASVLFYTLGISVLAGIIFGLAPALRARATDLQSTLKEGGRGGSGARGGVQRVFVVAEMALALVLLIGAGLMIRTLASLWSVDPGFNPRNVLTFSVNLDPHIAGNPAATRAVLRSLEQAYAAIPGIEAASVLAGSLPMNGDSELPFWKEDEAKPASEQDMKEALFYLIQPDYLRAMGIPLEHGRFFTERDDEHSPKVAAIDERFAKMYFPNQDPVGHHVNFDFIGPVEIVGVVGHVKHWGLDSDATAPVQPQVYMPIMQLPDQFFSLMVSGIGTVVRTSSAPTTYAGPIREALAKLDPNQVMYGSETMEEIVADSLAARRFSMYLLGGFAALALVLASIGIYGVISYLVGERTREIGIRVALGAQRRDVLQMVLGEGFKMAGIGVIVGLVAALGLTRLMSKMLYGVAATDPLTFIGVAAVLTFVALAACYIPARRAMRVDPIIALRYE
jgi:predicted permease